MLLPQPGYYYYVTKAYELKMSRPPLKKQTQNMRRLLKTVMIQFVEHRFLNILRAGNTKPGISFL